LKVSYERKIACRTIERSFFPHPIFNETAHDEQNKAGLLAPRSPSNPYLPAEAVVLIGLSSLVTAASPHGILTRFPILP